MPITSNEPFRTLGWRTELEIERERSTVEERDGVAIVRTPSNPNYHMGNILIFDRPPQRADGDRWPQLFEEAFASDAPVRHAAFAWSIEEQRGVVEPFVQRGYTYQERAVMLAREVCEFPVPEDLHVRPLASDRDWAEQLALGLATREEHYEPQGYAKFKTAQVAYHRLIAQKFGVWLGAFDGEHLAGSCGIFPLAGGVARYQDVTVLPEYRNRGIARALVGAAGRFALDRFGVKELVIVADADDFPRKIYERAGFTRHQREGALWIAHR